MTGFHNLPQDVQEAALNAYNSPPHELWNLIPSFMSDDVLETLAIAIMAERERCAKTVEEGLGLTNTAISRKIRSGE